MEQLPPERGDDPAWHALYDTRGWRALLGRALFVLAVTFGIIGCATIDDQGRVSVGMRDPCRAPMCGLQAAPTNARRGASVWHLLPARPVRTRWGDLGWSTFTRVGRRVEHLSHNRAGGDK